jgi:hypothetical protein
MLDKLEHGSVVQALQVEIRVRARTEDASSLTYHRRTITITIIIITGIYGAENPKSEKSIIGLLIDPFRAALLCPPPQPRVYIIISGGTTSNCGFPFTVSKERAPPPHKAETERDLIFDPFDFNVGMDAIGYSYNTD